MATGATAQSSASVAVSTVFRRVWKGGDDLVGAHGRFRVDQFIQLLRSQSWRSLGTLLVQLLRPLQRELEPESNACWSLNRCLIALAITVRYMQTVKEEALATVSDVQPRELVTNPGFVTKLFATMAQRAAFTGDSDNSASAAATAAAAYEVLCTISTVLTSADICVSSRFALDAVLNGILGPPSSSTAATEEAMGDRALLQPTAKRRRTSDDSHGALVPMLQLLTRALENGAKGSARKYAVRILRAQPVILKRLLLTTPADANTTCWRLHLVRALADCAADILDRSRMAGDGDAESEVTGGVFALLRDITPSMSLVVARDDEALAEPRARLLAIFGKLCIDLAALFRQHVADGTIYSFCAARRHRCYQWAALCRLSTWAATNSDSEPLAEGGYVCWTQIAYAVVSDVEPSIWLLLLAESLHHVALEYPSDASQRTPSALTPPFTLADESQVKVFTAVAKVLGRIGQITSALQLKPNAAAQSLIPGVVRACARLLRLVSPASASLGLFQPSSTSANAQQPADSASLPFSQSQCSLNAYIFRLDIPISSPTLSAASTLSSPPPLAQPPLMREDVAPSLLAEQEREAAEEVAHETTIANVFAALNSVARSITVEADTSAGRPGTLLAFRTILRWLAIYSSCARDNVGRQTRELDRSNRAKIRIIVDKARLHKSATDWSRLQQVSMARNTSTGDDKSLSATTYRSAVVQALHTLTALALWSLLEDEHSQSALHDLSLVWDSDGEEEEGAATKGSAPLLCRTLRRLFPDSEEFLGVSFSALQTLSSILGVRPHLIVRDVSQLRLPHLHVREHSPRSTEALMHLAVQNGLGRLLLEPAIVVRFIQHVCDGSMLRSSMMLRSMQMWLDMTGNVVRHSLFRSHLGVFASSAAVTGDVGAGLDFSTWWSLALAASARCLIGVAALGNDADARMIRLACAMPSHLLSWQAYLPASDISVSRLLDSRRIDGSNIRASSIRQLHAKLVSFSPPDITPAPTSIMYPVYFLACKLWLDSKLFDRPSGCDDHLALQISRDMWGIASDALQFLWRLITQPTLRRVFVNLGLVDDFASGVLVKLVSRQGFSDSISRCLRKREQAESPRSEERQLSGDTSDLVTIPLVESMNDKFELEYRSDSGGLESPSQPQPPLSASDLVGRLLDDISHSHKAGGGHSGGSSSRLPRRSAAEYYSEPMLGQLWYKFIDRLLQLPATIAFGRISSAADTAALRPTPADRRGELSEWLDDPDGVLFGLCEPLLTVRGALAQPSTMWDVMASAIPAGDILFTIREAAAAAKEGASLRMCISAAFLLPELDNSSSSATAAEPLQTDVEAVGPMLLEPLIRGLVGSSNDDDDGQRCLVALLFMAWRQRRRISDQVAKCAWQLKGDVVAMRDDLASCGPHLAAFSTTDLAEHIDAVGDLVLLSGHRKGLLEDNQTAVAASATLLARHSRVLEAMLAGSFAEAQTQSGAARRVSLQCDHEALTGMLDIYHRCLSTFSCSASSLSRKTMVSAVEGLRAELERDFSHDEMAAVLELAAFYGLRPVVALLAWVFSAGFSAVKVSAYSADTLDRLVLMHGDNLSGYQSSSEPLAIRRVLAAVLLLCLDQIDPASVVGDATDSFVSSALFLLYREQ